MNRKLTFVLTFVLGVIISQPVSSQILANAAGKLINSGDILFTTEINTAEKKKEVKETKTFTPQQAIYASFYINKKIANHSLFYQEGNNRVFVNVTLSIKDGASTDLSLDLKPEDKEKKASCVELAPIILTPGNYNHKKLADLFGDLKPGVYTVTMSLGDDIKGKFEMDMSNGTGKFGDLNKQVKEEEAKKAAEEKRKYEEEQKKRNEAVKKFQSSADVVKVAFKNKCDNPGSIYVGTGDDYTSFSMTLNKGEQSDYVICRPGNKVYLGNEVIHTVSAASKNKVIDFCPPKTEAQLKEESFQTGWETINVTVNNKCGNVVYYLVEQGGSTSNSFMNGNSSTTVYSLKKGHKIWLSDDKRTKISVLFEASSYSEKGTEVILCR